MKVVKGLRESELDAFWFKDLQKWVRKEAMKYVKILTKLALFGWVYSKEK